MCSNIFYLVFLIGFVGQTIAVPVSIAESGVPVDVPGFRGYLDQVCLKRTYSLTERVAAIKNLNGQLINSPDGIDEIRSTEEIQETIETLFSEIIEVLNTTNESELKQRYPTAMKHLRNGIVNALLSNDKDQLKTTLRMIADTSKELTAVLRPSISSIAESVIEDLINTIVITTELKKDPEFFFEITEIMNIMVNEANRYTGMEGEELKASFPRLADQINKLVESKNNPDVIKATNIIRERMLHQMERALVSSDAAYIPKFLQCIVEEAVIEVLTSDFYYEFSTGIDEKK